MREIKWIFIIPAHFYVYFHAQVESEIDSLKLVF